MKFNIFCCLWLMLSCSCTDKDNFPELSPITITAVHPESVFPGETIVIEGSGFKTERATVVIFPGNLLGRVVEASPTQLKVEVPRRQDVKGAIQVRTGADNYASSPNEFNILPYPEPQLNSLSVRQGPVGAPVVAEGNYLSEALEESDLESDIKKTKVLVGDVEAQVERVSFTNVWFKIPEGLVEGMVPVTVIRDGKSSAPVNFLVDKRFLIEDDFERIPMDDWTETNPPPGIGSNWSIGKGKWKISAFEGGGVLESTTGTDITLLNKSVKTQIDATNDFVVSGWVYVKTTAANGWGGIAFHVQDDRNYYALRISGVGSLQLVRIVNGSAGVVGLNSTAFQSKLKGLNFYHMEVAATAPYTFSVRITDINGGEIYSSPSPHVDTKGSFNGGYAGFYATSGVGAYYNDFKIESTTPGD